MSGDVPHAGVPLDISEEQADVLDAIERGDNVITLSLPGCGKSKLIEDIICAFPQRNIITISYNAKLVEASNERVRDKLAAVGKEDVPVCIKTFHALLSSLVKYVVHNDLLFSEALQCMNFVVLGLRWAYREFDMLIVDEAQDLRLPYVRFIIKLILQVCADKSKLQLVFLGDERQELYGFYPINKADARYLTLADELLGGLFPERKWYRAKLTVSYRATPQIATFVNALVPSRQMIAGNPNSNLSDWVTLYIADVYRDAAQIVYDIVKRAGVQNHGNIMILCSSLNEKSPVMRLVDLLVGNGVHVYVKRSGALADGVRGDSGLLGQFDDMCNKVCCETCHSSKGRQKPDIIFLNTSELLSEEFVTNPKYVALTRATRRLFIIQHAFYTSQNQIDALITNPVLKQRHLRIVQMRPIAQELKPKQARESKKDSLYYSKNALSAKTLFAFLDVAHLECLVEFVTYDTVVDGLAVKEEDNEEKCNIDDHVLAPCANYVADMTLSFNNAQTHINVTNICSIALQLMLEFAFTIKTPSFITQILQKIGPDMDPKFATMRNIIHDAIDVLLNNNALHEINHTTDGIVGFILKNASSFGKLAIAHDAFYGFRENLYAITNCDFCYHRHVQTRFRILYDTIQQILTEHTLVANDLMWHKECTGRFVHDSQPVQIKVCPAIASQNGQTVVCFTNNATTGHDDRFAAIVNAIVVSNGDETLQSTTLYVVNVFDASTQHICLVFPNKEDEKTSTLPKEEESSCKIEQTFKLETTVVNDDDDNTHCRDEKKRKLEMERRIPCDFLSAAIAFKTWYDDEDTHDDAVFDEAVQEEENKQFIANVHAEIEAIQREIRLEDICKQEMHNAFEKFRSVKQQQHVVKNNDVSDDDE